MTRFGSWIAVGLTVLCVLQVGVANAAKDIQMEASSTLKRKPVGGSSSNGAVPTAAIELICSDGTKLSVSTGNDTGSCNLTQQGTAVACGSALGGPHANAVCGSGCTTATGGATCQVFPKGAY